METRASYLLVGAIVLLLLAGGAAFTVWLVRADVDRQVDVYEIAFEGSVSGLQEGSQVLYRGIPVGRVTAIGFAPENVEHVLVTVELRGGTPIKVDTVATLEMQGITGIAYVMLRGGTQEAAALTPDDDEPPRIASRRSALERVFESTPELLARGLAVAERVTRVLEDDNLEALAGTLQNIETVTGALAGQSDDIGQLVTSASSALGQVEQVATEMTELSGELTVLSRQLQEEVGGVSGDLIATLDELRGAASALGGAAGQLDGMIGGVREPLQDFSASGLYEFTQMVGETRLLIAALTRITKEFERDPTGFLLGSSQRGFEIE